MQTLGGPQRLAALAVSIVLFSVAWLAWRLGHSTEDGYLWQYSMFGGRPGTWARAMAKIIARSVTVIAAALGLALLISAVVR